MSVVLSPLPSRPRAPPAARAAGSPGRAPALGRRARPRSAPLTESSRSARARSTWRRSSGFAVSGGGPAGGSARVSATRRVAFTPPPNSRPGCRSGIGRDDRPGRRVDEVHPAAQSGALERQPVAGQPQIAELRGQGDERLRLRLVAELRLVQSDLGAGVRQPGIRRRARPAGTRAGRAARRPRPPPRRAAGSRRVRGHRRSPAAAGGRSGGRAGRSCGAWGASHRHQLSSSPPTIPPSRPPPPSRWAAPPAPSCTGGWK